MDVQSETPQEASPRWGLGKVVMVILGGFLAVALLLGVGAYVAFQHFVSSLGDMNVYVEDLQTGRVRQLTTLGGCNHASLSPDGTTVLFQHVEGDKSSLMTHSLQDGATSDLLDDGHFNHSPVWGPRGRIFYVAQRDGQSHLWRRDVDGQAVQVMDGEFDGGDIQVSPDGEQVLFKSEDELFLVPATGGTPAKVVGVDNPLQGVRCFAWLHTPEEFAYVSFLSLVVAKADGTVVSSTSLAGLNNFSEMFLDPKNPDTIVIKAREADSLSLSGNLYRVSRRTGTWEVWKSGRAMLEGPYDIHRDGTQMVFTR